MTQSRSNWYWKLGLASSLVIGGAIASSKDYALAQKITPDTTLGAESSKVDLLTNQIEGGATRGTNLFHSFEQFSIPTNGKVHFNNDLGIQNIISRVAGSSVSSIDGLIQSNGAANLFLLNPKGITFGPNASLDVGGSFLASTASSLNFADGTSFSATAPQSVPLLTMRVPIGLQFGVAPGSIRNQSQASLKGATNSIGLPAGLQVPTSKTLALVGGNVELEGGNLTAAGGRIELGSVAGNSLVRLNPIEEGWALRYGDVQDFQDIQLAPQMDGAIPSFSFVDVTGENGAVQVQGRQVTLKGGSQILTTTQGLEQGGDLAVNASESVKLIGTLFGLPSALLSSTTAAGDAGNIVISTRRLAVQDGASISADSSGIFLNKGTPLGQFVPATGQGGDLTVNASESVELSHGFLSTSAIGNGDAGDLTITTATLTVQDGAQVTVSSLGSGDAGDLKVSAPSIFLDNQGILAAETTSGEGGNIRLHARDVRLRGGSRISTSASTVGGPGNGGDITINTDTLVGLENSDIMADASEGEGGFIRIMSQGIFGLEVREETTNNSDITAISRNNPLLNGVVEINTLDVELQSSLTQLSVNLVSPDRVVMGSCLARRNAEQGSFVITGTGGLPRNPYDTISGRYESTSIQPIQEAGPVSRGAATLKSSAWKPGDPIQEAQGMVVTADGRTIVGTTPQLFAVTKAQDLACHPK